MPRPHQELAEVFIGADDIWMFIDGANSWNPTIKERCDWPTIDAEMAFVLHLLRCHFAGNAFGERINDNITRHVIVKRLWIDP